MFYQINSTKQILQTNCNKQNQNQHILRMDLRNLVTVEYSINYNQNKLQAVIKQLESKLLKFDQAINVIDDKYVKLQQVDSGIRQKVDEMQQKAQYFEKFTVQNLRLALGEVANIKTGLRNYLGDQWIREQEKLQQQPRTHQSFESKLSAFNQQADRIYHKVNQLKTQLNTKSIQQQQKTQQVENTINEQRRHINKIRQSIREDIDEKIAQYKKQFQEKNIKYFYQKMQLDRELNDMKLIDDKDDDREREMKNTQKVQRQLKRDSITKDLQSNNQLEMKKANTLKQFSRSGINKKMESNKNDLNEPQLSTEGKSLKNLKALIGFEEQQTIQNGPTIMQQSMQHVIDSLRQELKLLIQRQIMEFKSSLQSLITHQQKMEDSITHLSTESQSQKTYSTTLSSHIEDIKNSLQNTKSSLYQNNEKQNQALARIIDLEQKTSHTQTEINTLATEFRAFVTQVQEEACQKFREMQNLDSMNSTKYRNSLAKNSMNTPILKDDNIFVQRLNLITEKIAKLQEKAKNQHPSQKNLPRINSSTHLNTKLGGNSPSMDLLRKDLQTTNQQLNKTNERLQTLKKNLKELQSAHSVIPNRLQKLQQKVTTISQIQQDRLLQLIKQLINRVLTDPFNNNFTNTLKRQIHVKFLEIKHEYSSIWKDIQSKVTDRAEVSQLLKLKQIVQSQNLQIKALVGKKTDNDDFKKGVKFLDNKLKELYSYLKVKETEENSPQGRKYYMGKKA